MKKINRTYVMGIVFVIIAAWVGWQSTMIPTRLVSNEPGPKMFPFISAAGMGLFAVLSMIFDGPKDAAAGNKPYLDKAGYLRLLLIMFECLAFAFLMNVIGFWITAMAGLFVFIMTLKGEKKVNLIFAIIFSIVLASICYFGFTKGFNIPLPSGTFWKSMGIKMP